MNFLLFFFVKCAKFHRNQKPGKKNKEKAMIPQFQILTKFQKIFECFMDLFKILSIFETPPINEH